MQGFDLSAQASIVGSWMPYWYRWACVVFDLVIAGYIFSVDSAAEGVKRRKKYL
jgi:hypothetical protein